MNIHPLGNSLSGAGLTKRGLCSMILGSISGGVEEKRAFVTLYDN
jgi:hypothetical protein